VCNYIAVYDKFNILIYLGVKSVTYKDDKNESLPLNIYYLRAGFLC